MPAAACVATTAGALAGAVRAAMCAAVLVVARRVEARAGSGGRTCGGSGEGPRRASSDAGNWRPDPETYNYIYIYIDAHLYLCI